MKFSKFFIGAMLAVALVSCSGKESLIKDYEKACEKGNAEKAVQILGKLDSKYKESDFTESEMERIDKATIVLESKALNALFE